MNWKGTRDGEAKCVFTIANRRAVRNDHGIICQLPRPTRYSGQDERYEQELEEEKHNQELIADAFNTIQLCDKLPSEILEQRDEAIKLLKYAMDELYLIHSQYGDKQNARDHSATLTESESFINKIENGQ